MRHIAGTLGGVVGPGPRAHGDTQATPLHTDKHSCVCTHSLIREHTASTHKPARIGLCAHIYTHRYTHVLAYTHIHT